MSREEIQFHKNRLERESGQNLQNSMEGFVPSQEYRKDTEVEQLRSDKRQAMDVDQRLKERSQIRRMANKGKTVEITRDYLHQREIENEAKEAQLHDRQSCATIAQLLGIRAPPMEEEGEEGEEAAVDWEDDLITAAEQMEEQGRSFFEEVQNDNLRESLENHSQVSKFASWFSQALQDQTIGGSSTRERLLTALTAYREHEVNDGSPTANAKESGADQPAPLVNAEEWRREHCRQRRRAKTPAGGALWYGLTPPGGAWSHKGTFGWETQRHNGQNDTLSQGMAWLPIPTRESPRELYLRSSVQTPQHEQLSCQSPTQHNTRHLTPSFACPPLRRRFQSERSNGELNPPLLRMMAPRPVTSLDASATFPPALSFHGTVRTLARSAIASSPTLLRERERLQQKQLAEEKKKGFQGLQTQTSKFFDPGKAARENKLLAKESKKKKAQELEERRAAAEARRRFQEDKQRREREEAAGAVEIVEFMGLRKTVPLLIPGGMPLSPASQHRKEQAEAKAAAKSLLDDVQRWKRCPWKDPQGYSFSQSKVQMRGGAQKRLSVDINI